MNHTTRRFPTRQQLLERTQQPLPPVPTTNREPSTDTQGPTPFVKKTTLERLENEGGPTDPDAPETDTSPTFERRGYDIVT
jgi:hypothetical protein